MKIPTSIRPEETDTLLSYASGCTVLEVGSQFGYSAIEMAQVAQVVHSVDWHQGDPNAGFTDTLPTMWANLNGRGLRDKVVLHVGRTDEVLPFLRPESFSFAFHDGDHSTEGVLHDVALMQPLMQPDSCIAFHDYGRYGVKKAVDSLGWERVALVRSLVVLRVA